MSESNVYFAEVATEWDTLRSGFFTEAMRDAAIAGVGLPTPAVVADVGTGTGFMLQGLVDKAAHLVGFDASAEMLEIARENLAAHPHVSLRLAEGRSLPAPENSFDAVFANMYLHHAPEPLETIREMVRILKPGGKLIITDLDRHDQNWMRQAMADYWLGFEREEVRHWYEAAGLTAVTLDCAAGTCDCTAPGGGDIALSIFVAMGQK